MDIKATDIKDSKFVLNVLKALEPMGDSDCVAIDDKMIGLYKNEVMFGFILGSELYLRTKVEDREIYHERYDFQGKKYNKLCQGFPLNSDNFLQVATDAYWIACGKR